MVIVDTTVWVDYLRGTYNPQTDWLERELLRQRLGVTDLILCEILQGVRGEIRLAEVRDELLRFEVFSTCGIAQCIAAARNYQALREHGYTVRKTIDCLIATFCLEGGHTLLHRDHDFDPFENLLRLQVVHP